MIWQQQTDFSFEIYFSIKKKKRKANPDFQGTYKVNLEHVIVQESKKVLKDHWGQILGQSKQQEKSNNSNRL